EYFGIEETIKEITEGTTIGGVTLAEFKQLKEKINELEKQFSSNRQSLDKLTQIVEQNKTISSLPEQKQIKDSKPQLELLSELNVIKPIPAQYLSKKRFGLSKDALAAYKRKHTQEELSIWTKEKDPDDITWVLSSDKKGYVPKDELPSELLDKLKDWIEANLQAN
ncbi:MAG: hypothetical protein ACRDBG_26800, partial [Waterburya sp.]